jgi:shikimate kinase
MTVTNQEGKRAVDSLAAERSDRGALRTRDASIVITGFMGTGKTSVGQLVADRLGRAFVDMDTIIETRENKTVQEIFASRGEAYFRQCEMELCKELRGRRNLVIATGGGTLVDPENRACFHDAFVFCLDATVDTLVGRLKNATDRPLMQGEELRGRVNSLLLARRSAYEEIDMHIDTTGKTVDQVAAEIIAMFRAAQEGAGRGAD